MLTKQNELRSPGALVFFAALISLSAFSCSSTSSGGGTSSSGDAGTTSDAGGTTTPNDAGSTLDAGSTGAAFEAACHVPGDCASGVCFLDVCSKHCTVAADCPSPWTCDTTSGICTN
jgi:hypothetical protein